MLQWIAGGGAGQAQTPKETGNAPAGNPENTVTPQVSAPDSDPAAPGHAEDLDTGAQALADGAIEGADGPSAIDSALGEDRGQVDGTTPGAGPVVPAAPPHYRTPAPPAKVGWKWERGPADSGSPLHSGFFTQVQLLAGLFGVRAGRPGVSDGIVDGTGIAVAVGHSVIKDRLVGYLRYGILGDQSPRSLGVGSLELGGAYFFEPSELMVGLHLGSTTVHYIDPAGKSRSPTGPSVAATVARHWPVHGGPLALGVCALARFAGLGDGLRYGALSAGLSMTYH